MFTIPFPNEGYSQIDSLSVREFISLSQEISFNENIKDATLICYQVFQTIVTNEPRGSVLNNSSQLNIIAKPFKLLYDLNKLDVYKFTECLFKDFTFLPLELIWWLHKHEIMYLSQYCDRLNACELAHYAIDVFKNPVTEIAQNVYNDFLLVFIEGYYTPNQRLYNLQSSKTWSDYCLQGLNTLIEEFLKSVLERSDQTVNVFNCWRNLTSLPPIVNRRFFEKILHRLLTHHVGEYDIYSSYMYQQLWHSEVIDKNLFVVFEKIFEEHCDIQSILDIIDDGDDKVNWKYVLIAVGMFVRKSSRKAAVTGAAMNFLNDSFKGGKVECFMKAFLFIRQSCMEKNMNMTYASWYTTTFGRDSIFITTKNATLFKFIMNALTSFIPYEPLNYLNMQIELVVAAPIKCNFVVHDYKNLCKARLSELRKSRCIPVNAVDIPVLHLIEECNRLQKPGPLLLNIINKQRDVFYEHIVPQVLRDKLPYTTVKELLLQEGYLSNEVIGYCEVGDNQSEDDLIIIQ